MAMSLLGKKIMDQMNKIGEPRKTTTTMEVPKQGIDFGQLGLLLAMMLNQPGNQGGQQESPLNLVGAGMGGAGTGAGGAGVLSNSASGGAGASAGTGAAGSASVSPFADMNPAQISNLLQGVVGMPSGVGNSGVFKYLLQLMGGDR
jgi:hypothetical protein